MTCLKSLRDAAMREVDPLKREALRQVADSLQASIARFKKEEDREALVQLNGAWSHAWRTLELATPVPDPTHPTSELEEAREELAA